MRTGSNMTDFLVKTFVKDYENTGDIGVRTEYGLMASTVGICCNVLLFAAKLFIGLLINSISVMADAFNNLSDAASSYGQNSHGNADRDWARRAQPAGNEGNPAETGPTGSRLYGAAGRSVSGAGYV